MSIEDSFDCVVCGKPKKKCQCERDPISDLNAAFEKADEILSKAFPSDAEAWQCRFCGGTHSNDFPCQEIQAAEERLKKSNQEHLRQSLEDPRQWPPAGKLVKEWVSHGLRCAIASTPHSYCAYVHLPEGHPDEHKTYDELDVDVRAHGGLTFRQKADGGGSWFGFDFAHGDDWIAMPPEIGDCPGKMWELKDVVKETRSLAKQLEKRAKVKS